MGASQGEPVLEMGKLLFDCSGEIAAMVFYEKSRFLSERKRL